MIFSATILLLIFLPILISLLLSLPHIQNKVIDRATIFASEYLGTEVSIGRVDMTLTGRIEIYDFLTRDFEGDTLLMVKRLNSRLLAFRDNKLTLGSSVIDGGELSIRETASGEMNIKQVTDKLANRDSETSSDFVIECSDIEVENFAFGIERLKRNNPQYGVDMRNLKIRQMCGEVEDLSIRGSNISGDILSLSGVEQSGFEIQDVKGRLDISSGCISLNDMSITTRWSSLNLSYLTLTDKSWSSYSNFVKSTVLGFEVDSGYLSSDDIAYFAPSMRNWGVEVYDLELTAAGTISALNLDIENLRYGDSTILSANIKSKNLPEIERAWGDVDLRGLTTAATDIDNIIFAITQKELSEKSRKIITTLGQIEMTGGVVGTAENFDVDANMLSEAGDVTTKMNFTKQEVGTALAGEVRVSNAKMGEILGANALERITINTRLNGVMAGVQSVYNIQSFISSVELKDRLLRNIAITAKVNDEAINADVTSHDKNLLFDMTSEISGLELFGRDSTASRVPTYDIGLNLHEANLAALKLNKRDTLSKIACDVQILATGDTLDSGTLQIDMTSGAYVHDRGEVATRNMMLSGVSTPTQKNLTLVSDFANIYYSSTSGADATLKYLRKALSKYLPNLYNESSTNYTMSSILEVGDDEAEIANIAENNSTLIVEAHDLTPIAEAVSEGLMLGDETRLEAQFDVEKERFVIDLKSNIIERKSILMIGLGLNVNNVTDSLTLRGGVKELFVGTNYIENGELVSKALNDDISLGAKFLNTTDSTRGHIGAKLLLAKRNNGERELKINLLPSSFSRGEKVWNMRSKEIYIDNRGVAIDQFRVKSNNQLLEIYGRASRSLRDTVTVKMNDFDLSVLSSVVAKLGYNVKGRTSGKLIASSALDNARIEAEIGIDSVSLNNIVAPPMDMSVRWDTKLNQARLFLTNRVKRDTLVRGYYIPTLVRYYAKAKVDSLNMGVLDPPLGGVIKNTTGYADLDLSIQGTRRTADLSGEIKAYDVATTIGYTKVRYSIPEAQLKVSNNQLICKDAKVYDKLGGEGMLNLSVDLQHLSNIGYKIRMQPKNMLVLNTEERDNSTFYGELYTTGLVTIDGDKRGVNMNIAAKSERNSKFYLPLNNQSDIAQADFITFVQPQVSISDDLIARRRELFEKQQRGSESKANLSINMALDVEPNTEVQIVIDPTVGDIIRAKGEGRFNLKVEPSSNIFEIYGNYTITEGNYLFTLQNIVNKRFVINPGSTIQWSGSPTDARLDIAAIYKLKASLQPLIAEESPRAVPVDCIINLTESLTHPDVSFEIDLPTATVEQQTMLSNLLNDQETISKQFFYLMLANSFIAESSGVGSDFGATATAATGFELLTNQLSNWLSSSNYNIVLRYRPESEVTGEEVDFGFSKGLINNRLLVELEGNYIIDNKQAISDDASNFMGEAYITWLIDQAGALKLKGFTQTIDSYDENQGLQETGVGVYYTEDFDNFKDLRERVKARFKRKKKKSDK